MARDDDTGEEVWAYVETTLWAAASMFGPVPWVLLATRELERLFGSTGYGVAFAAAPALWTGLAIAAFLTDRRRLVIGWAAVGSAIWWGFVA